MKEQLLKEGDIIELEKGHTVYMRLPCHFVYNNAFGNFAECTKTEVTIGENKGGLDTSFLVGRYVVTSAYSGGGGTGMGAHDIYPDGWYITCQRLMKTDASLDGRAMDHRHPLTVWFYQTGAFTAMIRDIKPVARAIATWHEAT